MCKTLRAVARVYFTQGKDSTPALVLYLNALSKALWLGGTPAPHRDNQHTYPTNPPSSYYNFFLIETH